MNDSGTSYSFLWWIVGLVVIGGGAWFFLRGRRRGLPLVDEEKPEVTFADIVGYFKKPAILEKLKANPDLLAVTLREKKGDDLLIVMGLFNEKNGEVEPVDCIHTIKTRRLDEAAARQFGDKGMIILK